MSYAQYWTPQTLDEAIYSVDTGKDGEAFWAAGRECAAMLTAWTGLEEFGTVLDYGCGVGRVLCAMPAKRKIGVDISQEMLEFARQFCPDAELLLGDGSTIPLQDNSIDLIYSFLTLQHMDAPDVVNILAETARVLKSGGYICHTFSRFGDSWDSQRRLVRSGLRWSGHRETAGHGAHVAIAYTDELVQSLAKNAGFVDCRLGQAGSEYIALIAQKAGEAMNLEDRGIEDIDFTMEGEK